MVVHGVLNPSANEQVVLVERTLRARSTFRTPTLRLRRSDRERGWHSDARRDGRDHRFTRTRQHAASKTGRSVRVGKGAGVYRVPLRRIVAHLGSRYQLRVRTTTGEELTAFTRVPRRRFEQTAA